MIGRMNVSAREWEIFAQVGRVPLDVIGTSILPKMFRCRQKRLFVAACLWCKFDPIHRNKGPRSQTDYRATP